MEFHVLHWPDGARFTRVRVEEGGIPRDAAVHLVPPIEPGAPAELLVCHHGPLGDGLLEVVLERSQDGVHWSAVGGSEHIQAA